MSLVTPRRAVLCALLIWGWLAAPPAWPAETPAPRCQGHPATIIGTPNDDWLKGTRGDDVICAGDGDDTVTGGSGDDLICAGPGNDTVTGGAGADTLLGAEGDDSLNGNDGPDRLSGGPGGDLLVGEPGDDVAMGGLGDDLLRGGAGADRLFGEDGRDTLSGGDGDDTLSGGDGDDVAYGGPGADYLQGGNDSDSLRGQEGPDRLFGGASDDFLSGGDGDDTLRGKDGRDRCDGGDGRDEAATCEEFAATEFGQVAQPRFRPGPTQVALTFDDGPLPQNTRQILDILERYQVPATFFVIGRQAADNPELLQRMVAEGHSVQNHTWGHYWLTRYSDTTIADQLARANQAIEGATGDLPHCYRPPFGAVNDRVRSVAAGLSLTTIMWDVDPWDWKHPGSAAVASHVLRKTGGGDIVLFHDSAGWSTIGALPAIIEGLRARGLEFVTICSTPILAPEASQDRLFELIGSL